jgi:hypothetical protein
MHKIGLIVYPALSPMNLAATSVFETANWKIGSNAYEVTSLVNYQLQGFSVERLMNFLTALDQDVDIVICRKPRSRKGGRILVTAA